MELAPNTYEMSGQSITCVICKEEFTDVYYLLELSPNNYAVICLGCAALNRKFGSNDTE